MGFSPSARRNEIQPIGMASGANQPGLNLVTNVDTTTFATESLKCSGRESPGLSIPCGSRSVSSKYQGVRTLDRTLALCYTSGKEAEMSPVTSDYRLAAHQGTRFPHLQHTTYTQMNTNHCPKSQTIQQAIPSSPEPPQKDFTRNACPKSQMSQLISTTNHVQKVVS